MEDRSKELSAFIQDINRGILSSMYMEAVSPVQENGKIICFLSGLRVSMDVRVNADGHVTHGQDVAAKMRFHFCFKADGLIQEDLLEAQSD